MFQNSGFQSGPSKGVRLSFLTQADQAKFEQLFAQSAGPYGGSKIPAQTVSDLLRRSNLDNDTLAKIWDLSSIANAPHLTFPEFAVAMFLTSKKLTGQALPASLPPDVREETEIAMATIESTETSRQLVSTSTPPIQPQQQFMNQQLPMMTGMQPQMTSMQPQMTSMQPQMTSMQPQMTSMQPQMTSMQPQMTAQMPMMTGRPTPPPVPQLPMQTGFSNNFQAPMQTGFRPSQPPTKPRLQNLDFAKKMMPNQSGVTNLLNPNLGTKDSERISWKISPEEKQRYREIFDAWDGTGTGFMSGETAKDVLTQSQLPPEDLMKIWTLADSDNKGSLDNDEFAIAMHLVYRKLNGFEIPSVLPPELRPPSSVLKKFVIGRRAPSAMPSFGSPSAHREENEDSLYGNNQHDYVSSSRRKGPPPSVSARSSSYSSLDQDEDAHVLEDLRRQISETQRQLNRMPKVTTSSYSSKYSLEELKEKIRRAHEDLHHATRTNHLSSKYFENKETLLGLIETQKSLQDEIQYLCNRDIPVLARQLRSSAAELRDAKVRNSRKTDTAQDYMAYVQPTGPGGSITESDRVRAKAKAMMAARKAGSTGSSSDAGFVLRRAEEEKEEIDRRADTIERDMEKARTSLLDMRGDLKYLEEMTAAKDLEDKKRFDNGQDLSYELRRFIEQLDTKSAELASYSRAPDNFRSSAVSSPALSTGGYQSPPMGASSPALSSPAPKPSPARPRTAEEIKKEAERRVQERLAAIQAKRNPGSSPRISAPSTPSTSFAVSPTNNKPNESEAEAERAAQEMLRASVSQREELDRKKREADLERIREDERLERQRQEQREREKAEEEQRARIQQEEDEKRREQEDREFEERRRQRLAKEEADRQARFDAIKRHEEEEEAKKAQDTSYKPEEAPASEPTPPPPVNEPSAASNATSTNNPFAKFQQSTTAEPSSPQTEKPNEPASKRVSYNPFAAFSAFSATKGGSQDDSDSDDDDGWDVTHNDSEDENEFPAAGSAKNLAGMLFDAMSKRNDNDVSQEASRKPDVADTSVPSPPPPPPPAPPAPAAPIPPLAPASNQADSTPSIPPTTGGDMRSALLSQIQSGKTLKKTTTNDRSASSIAGRVVGDASTSSTSSAPVVAPEPVSVTTANNNAPLSSSGFLAELQSRTGGGDSSPNEPSQTNVAATHAPNTAISQDDALPETEYVAVWDYTGAGSDDLSFSQDDVILVRDNNENEDWWYGTLQSNGKKGYFPRNYVQLKPEAVPNLNIKAKALYDFEGPEGQGCLDLKMGETVVVLVKENNDWWKAQSEDGIRVGLVPANYLEEQA